MQEAIEPETIAAVLVAGEDHRSLGKTEPSLGASDLRQDPCGLASWYRDQTSALTTGGRRRELPLTGAQLESEVEQSETEVVELTLWVAVMSKLLEKEC
jgi:hypothetical protein